MTLIHDKLTGFWYEVFSKKDQTHGFGPSLRDFTDQIYMNELWFFKHILGLKIFLKVMIIFKYFYLTLWQALYSMLVEMWSSHKEYGLIVDTSNSDCKIDRRIGLGFVLFNWEFQNTHIIILSISIGIEMNRFIRG